MVAIYPSVSFVAEGRGLYTGLVRVAVTKYLWVGDVSEALPCETVDAALYFLEMDNPPRVVVPDLEMAAEVLEGLVDLPNQRVLMQYARRRWLSGHSD